MGEGLIVLCFLLVVMTGLGLLAWSESEGYAERVRFRRERNKIALDRMRAETALDLKLKEWQQTKSLEELERHRQRLEGELDEEHGVRPAMPQTRNQLELGE